MRRRRRGANTSRRPKLSLQISHLESSPSVPRLSISTRASDSMYSAT